MIIAYYYVFLININFYVDIFTDNNFVLEKKFAKISIWACMNFRAGDLFVWTNSMKFTTLVICEDTNSNISVYKTIIENKGVGF